MSLDATGTRAANAAAVAMNTDLGLGLGAADLARLKVNLRPIVKELLLELINNGAVSSNGATAAHGVGAPATITALPGTIS